MPPTVTVPRDDASAGRDLPPADVLVTGGAGFIGSHLTRALLGDGARVVVLDALVPFYDPAIKEARVAALRAEWPERFTFVRGDVADADDLRELLSRHRPRAVVHLAAQPGVRFCEAHPAESDHANVTGMRAVVDAAEAEPAVEHLIFSSSSSVYGRQPGPWGEELPTAPVGRYAASKAAGEVLCREAAARGRLAVSVLRLFSVYGPDGRPDMAPLAFTRMVHGRRPVTIFGDGAHSRDFTHVRDVVDAFVRCVGAPPPPGGARTCNVGGGSPCTVLELLAQIERETGRRSVRQHLEARPEDVPATRSRPGALRDAVGWVPAVRLAEGVSGLVRWFHRTRPLRLVAVVASAAAGPAAVREAVEALSGSQSRPLDHVAAAPSWRQGLDDALKGADPCDTYAALVLPGAEAEAWRARDGHAAACEEAVRATGCDATAGPATRGAAARLVARLSGAAPHLLFVRADLLARELAAAAGTGDASVRQRVCEADDAVFAQ